MSAGSVPRIPSTTSTMYNRFLLGSIEIDPAVKSLLGREPLDLVSRHAVCDFGLVSARRAHANFIGVAEGGEIISEYAADPTDPKQGRIRVITCAGWGLTHVSWIPAPKPTKKRVPPNELPF